MADNVQTTAEAEKTKYLSKAGLTTFWGKVKALVTAAVVTVGDYTVNGKKISTNPVIVFLSTFTYLKDFISYSQSQPSRS